MLADQVLYSGIACIVDLIVKEGLINLDLADVNTVLSGMGTAMMGTGEASGEQRAIVAAEEAIVNPLLDDVTLKGAKSLLLSITGGRDLTLWEVDEAANRVREELDPDANIIVGATLGREPGRPRARVDRRIGNGALATRSAVRRPDRTRTCRRPACGPGLSRPSFRGHRRATASKTPLRPTMPGGATLAGPRRCRTSRMTMPRSGKPTRALTARKTVRSPAMADPCPPWRIFRPLRNANTGPKPVTPARRRGRSRHDAHHESDTPQRRPGLLQGLTGAGRDGMRSQVGAMKTPPHDGNGAGSHGSDEQVDLPVFFGRDKRS